MVVEDRSSLDRLSLSTFEVLRHYGIMAPRSWGGKLALRVAVWLTFSPHSTLKRGRTLTFNYLFNNPRCIATTTAEARESTPNLL